MHSGPFEKGLTMYLGIFCTLAAIALMVSGLLTEPRRDTRIVFFESQVDAQEKGVITTVQYFERKAQSRYLYAFSAIFFLGAAMFLFKMGILNRAIAGVIVVTTLGVVAYYSIVSALYSLSAGNEEELQSRITLLRNIFTPPPPKRS